MNGDKTITVYVEDSGAQWLVTDLEQVKVRRDYQGCC